MNILDSLGEALRNVITFVPKLLAFLVILLIGWLIAKALRKLVTMGLKKVGFDRAVERGGISRALENSKYDAVGIVAAVVYFGVLLIALQMAFGVFGPNPVSELLTEIVAWLPRLVVAIVILVIAAAAGRVLGDLAGSALGGVSWGSIAAKGVHIFVVALGVIAALGQIGVATLVTAPVLIAVLATVGGILVVGIGGGMVKPMQQRWERWLHKAETEAPIARRQMEAYKRGREDATRAHTTTPAPPTPVEQHHATVGAAQHSVPEGMSVQEASGGTVSGTAFERPTGQTGQHSAYPPSPPTTPVQQPSRGQTGPPQHSTQQPPPRPSTSGPQQPGFPGGTPPMPPPKNG